MKKWIVDRFEGSFAVCENEMGHKKTILKALLPADTMEGDCIVEVQTGEEITYIQDQEETKKRKQDMKNRMSHLFED